MFTNFEKITIQWIAVSNFRAAVLFTSQHFHKLAQPHIIFSRSTLQMLTNIENRLEELFEQIEMMPPDKVEMAEKVEFIRLGNYRDGFTGVVVHPYP